MDASSLPPSRMLDVIGRVSDRVMTCVSLLPKISFVKNDLEAAEMVDLGLVNRGQFDSLLRYRDECCAEAVTTVAFPLNNPNHFIWMSGESRTRYW